jgi:hypothetical protein
MLNYIISTQRAFPVLVGTESLLPQGFNPDYKVKRKTFSIDRLFQRAEIAYNCIG